MAAAQYLDKDRLIMKLSRYDQNWFGPSSFLDAHLQIKVLPPMTNYCKSFACAMINDMMKSPSGQTHSSSLPTEARLGQLDLGCCSFPRNYTVKRSVQVHFREAPPDKERPPGRRSRVTPRVDDLGAVADGNAVTRWSQYVFFFFFMVSGAD